MQTDRQTNTHVLQCSVGLAQARPKYSIVMFYWYDVKMNNSKIPPNVCLLFGILFLLVLVFIMNTVLRLACAGLLQQQGAWDICCACSLLWH